MMSCQTVMRHLLVVLVTLLDWSQVETASSIECPDQYVYTQQPPQEIFICNPYVGGKLSMSCSVLGQNVVDIQWWFAPDSVEENATELMQSSKYTLTPKILSDDQEGLEVQLTISRLGDEDVGTYWCQATVEDAHGIQLLSASESVELMEESRYDEYLIQNECTFVLKNSDFRCATILVTPPMMTTTLPEPSISTSTLRPSFTSLPETFTSQRPTAGLVSDFPTNPGALLQTSSIILYSVLGLVGFLVVACILLIVIVVMLCRRKCAKRNLKSSSDKEAGFDLQLSSNQSGYPPSVYKHAEAVHVIHTNTHHRTMSGEYAEIGPALSISQEYGHPDILFHSSVPPIPGVTDPGYENPYDLLVFAQATPTDDVKEVMEGADPQCPGSHDYHVLEHGMPVTLDSATPVVSPQHTYHTLEYTAVPLGDDDHDAMSAYDDIIQCESPSQRLSCDSPSELIRLPTIPENDFEDQKSIEYLNMTKSNVTSDAVSPDLSTRLDLKGCTGFFESSKDDREYDRLVDPPHLYHVLEHSPVLRSGPRICNFDVTTISTDDYSHLEAGRCMKAGESHLVPHIHFVSQLTDVKNASEPYSSESSLDSTESNLFDDPQYHVGLPRQTRVVKSACSMQEKLKELQKCHNCAVLHGRLPTLVPRDKTQAHSDSILMKYSGDYERDPVYMQRLYNENSRSSSQGDSTWCDDSGFVTYSSKFSLQDRAKRYSLPNLGKHIYQPLETETMEPLQPYDKLQKTGKETIVVSSN